MQADVTAQIKQIQYQVMIETDLVRNGATDTVWWWSVQSANAARVVNLLQQFRGFRGGVFRSCNLEKV
jgi:conjugal transfer/entry exclusion protein